jgi:hypothetical protein
MTLTSPIRDLFLGGTGSGPAELTQPTKADACRSVVALTWITAHGGIGPAADFTMRNSES